MRRIFYLIIISAYVCFSACEKESPTYDYPGRYQSQVFDSIKVTRDIYYKTAVSFAGKRTNLFFDFYEPYGDSIATRPLVILMHGGGFIQGHRGWMDSIAYWLPHYGYSCANISYRLYDGPDFPLGNEDFLISFLYAREDLISAIDYFIGNSSGIDPYKTDIQNIYIAGASAGGIAALHTVPIKADIGTGSELFRTLQKIDGRIPSSSLRAPSAQIKGILSFAGAIMDTNLIGQNYPGIFCVHGTEDNIVPFYDGMIQIRGVISPFEAYGSGIICSKAARMGLKSMLIADQGAGHDNFFKKGDIWKNDAIIFLYESVTGRNLP